MIELEDHGIDLTAIRAWMSCEVLEDMSPERVLADGFGRSGLAAMQIAALAEVRGEAASAPPLMTVAQAVEQLDRKVEPAATAPANATRRPDR